MVGTSVLQCGKSPFADVPGDPSKWVQGVGLREAWRQMEVLRDEGKAKSVGVSNFRISDLEESQKGAKVGRL